MTKELILIKLGGSLITNKKSSQPECRIELIKYVANIISKSDKKFIIVHGAGSYGHPIAKKYKINKGLDGSYEQKEAINTARMQVRELNEIVCSEMEKVELKCESVIPSNTMEIDNEDNILNFPKNDFDKILSKGKVALTFGDIVKNNENDVRILSGDTILLKLSQIYKPKKTFFIMEYPGVVKGNLKSENLEIYEEINSEFTSKISIVNEENRPDVTGGLLKKIECALEISKNSDCWISGVNNLNKCINGRPEGTRVVH